MSKTLNTTKNGTPPLPVALGILNDDDRVAGAHPTRSGAQIPQAVFAAVCDVQSMLDAIDACVSGLMETDVDAKQIGLLSAIQASVFKAEHDLNAVCDAHISDATRNPD